MLITFDEDAHLHVKGCILVVSGAVEQQHLQADEAAAHTGSSTSVHRAFSFVMPLAHDAYRVHGATRVLCHHGAVAVCVADGPEVSGGITGGEIRGGGGMRPCLGWVLAWYSGAWQRWWYVSQVGEREPACARARGWAREGS